MVTLSVIMANYNHSKYLPISLTAILNQSCPPLEVIVIDDASTDESLAVLKKMQATYPQLKVYQNHKNLGPSETVCRGVKLASGDYIIFASADDQVLPGFFEKSLKLLAANPSIGMLCTDPAFFYDGSNHHMAKSLKISKEVAIFTGSQVVNLVRYKNFYISGHTAIYRKDKVIEYGGPLDELKMVSDLFLSYQIAFGDGLVYIPEALSSYRIVPNCYEAKISSNRIKRNRIYAHLLDKILQEQHEIVKKRLIQSGFIFQCGFSMVKIVLSNSCYWKFLPPLLPKLPWMVLHSAYKVIKRFTKKLSRRNKSMLSV